MRKRNNYSLKIRIAMFFTALILTPGALGIGVLIKHNILKDSDKKIEISPCTENDNRDQKEKDLSVRENSINLNLEG
ncbi:MAG: hypothetical protein E6772_00770 [Dysgonomonas sp.]|nr:hypothetical protein [Dysgonomonas sp.]